MNSIKLYSISIFCLVSLVGFPSKSPKNNIRLEWMVGPFKGLDLGTIFFINLILINYFLLILLSHEGRIVATNLNHRSVYPNFSVANIFFTGNRKSLEELSICRRNSLPFSTCLKKLIIKARPH